MEFKQLSIKNFIGDLPNIINSNFEIIKTFFSNFFIKDNDKMSLQNINKINATIIDCSSINAANILIKKEDASLISLDRYINECIETYIKNNNLVN